MTNRQPRHSHEEFARLGEEVYQRRIRPTLRSEDDGKFVAIDIESGEFEIDPDDFSATDRLLKRLPDAQTWLMRVGRPTAYTIGHAVGSGGTA
jgi:hypothetical protein